MAFGSWFKNIVSGAKSLIGKALPAFKKGLEIASKVAPVIGQFGGIIGGPVGSAISTASNVIGNASGKLSNKLGANGAGRFAVPMLK